MVEGLRAEPTGSPVMRGYEYVRVRQLRHELRVLEQLLPSSVLQVPWKQHFESPVLDKHGEAQIVRVRKLRIRITERRASDTAHPLVKRQCYRMHVLGMNPQVAFDVIRQFALGLLDSSQNRLIWRPVSVERRDRDPIFPQAVQAAEMVLVRIRNEQVVEARATELAPNERARTPARRGVVP